MNVQSRLSGRLDMRRIQTQHFTKARFSSLLYQCIVINVSLCGSMRHLIVQEGRQTDGNSHLRRRVDANSFGYSVSCRQALTACLLKHHDSLSTSLDQNVTDKQHPSSAGSPLVPKWCVCLLSRRDETGSAFLIANFEP